MDLTNPKQLLRLIHDAPEDAPVKGIDLQPDELAVLTTLVTLGYAVRDEITDRLGLTTLGRTLLGLKPEGVPELPVTVSEATGNIEERELVARYIERKVAGIDKALGHGDGQQYHEAYAICAIILTELAGEIRREHQTSRS